MPRSLMANEQRVPAHLRQYIVEQDYSAYDEVAHAIWRFVLLHTYERLTLTAHPAYARGLHETGMSVERIPRIAEMDERLSRFGWGAACVDGFIPPRAFVELQAVGILPIAADIRSLAHLAYTPAPDIIHEAAGHAPILVDPEYRSFIQHFGQIGSKAFTVPEDAAVHRAIYSLSEIKEDPSSTPEQVEAATRAVDVASRACVRVSEAARLARLYWWTAEYGLIGNNNDYKLYGAGLLSSLWESYSCHLPEVRKLPLSAECIQVAYDITRAQPQLFVTESFSQLATVLEQVANGLAFQQGATVAARHAVDSEEVATLELDSDVQISGVLFQYEMQDDELAWVQFTDRNALYRRQVPLRWRGRPLEVSDYRLPLGDLDASSSWNPHRGERLEGEANLRYRNGSRVLGRVVDTVYGDDGKVNALIFQDATISIPNRPPCHDVRLYPLVFGRCLSGYAGAAHPSFHVIGEARTSLVPRPRTRSVAERQLLALYERALEAWRTQGSQMVAQFEAIGRDLDRHFPDEWLLRWNLMESLLKIGSRSDSPAGRTLIQSLRGELEALELRYQHREPIAMGLRSLLQHYPEPINRAQPQHEVDV